MNKQIEQLLDYSYELRRFYKYVRPLRYIIGYSDGEISQTMGISRSTYRKYESLAIYPPTWFFLAFDKVYHDTLLAIEHSDFYDELWWCMINGINNDNSEFKEEDADLIASEILKIAEDQKRCPRKYGAEFMQATILHDLFNIESPSIERCLNVAKR